MPFCNNCEKETPPGCRHIYGIQPKCILGPRTDLPWIVGLAVYQELSYRRGIKQAIEDCDDEVQAELIETLGRAALDVIESKT